MPAGTTLPDMTPRRSPGPKGKSAPAAFGTRPHTAAASNPGTRGRTVTPKSPSPHKADRNDPRQRPLSPVSDTSSGLGTPVESDSGDSSSGPEDAAGAQLATRTVSSRDSAHMSKHTDGHDSIQSRPEHMATPFYAPAQMPPLASSPSQESISKLASTVELPRADVMVIGGDLAYPNPSNETYEQRFFRPFEAALPPPPHVRPGRLVVAKPDLPGVESLHHAGSSRTTSSSSR